MEDRTVSRDADEEEILLDEDGVPLLRDLATTRDRDRAPNGETITPALSEAIRSTLDDIASDMQSEISWKIESLLEQTVKAAVHDAIQQGSPQILESVRNQLHLALPELFSAFRRGEVKKD
jgi:hypothetical protein